MTYIRLNIPQFRKSVNKFEETIARKKIKLMVSDKENLKRMLEEIDMGDIDKSKINIDELIAAGMSDTRLRIEVPKEKSLFQGIKQHKALFEEFQKMDWTFWFVEDDSYFITSDMPVIPVCKNWNLPFAPGYGNADKIFFPITKKICLAGQRSTYKPNARNVKINGYTVNTINKILEYHADMFLYSPLNQQELLEQEKKYPTK